ncbi:MAG: hypothetical protein ACI4C0_03250 [Lachnospiraceae bacterium]
MRKRKRIIILILMVVLSVSLCGCGDASKKLYGTWETTIDYSSAMEEVMGFEYEDFHHSFEIKMLLEFNEDGTYCLYADVEIAKETFDVWIKDFISYSVEALYKEFEESDMSRNDVDAVIQEQYGCSVEEYMTDEIYSELDFDDYVSEMKTEGIYQAKGDNLILNEDDGYRVFTIEADTLTIDIPEGVNVEEDEIIDGVDYPMIFTKIITE